MLEVLPAAILRFPGIFLDIDKVPKDLREILDSIISGETIRGEWRGIDMTRIGFWLNSPLGDGRSVPFKERRVVKSFRLSPTTVRKIEHLAALQHITHSDVIDRLIAEKAVAITSPK